MLSCTSCSQSVKDLFFVLPFGKRVQRYGNFPNWQNISASFFKKNDKKGEIGQKMRKKREKSKEKSKEKGGKTRRRRETKKPRQSHGILNKDDERERGFMGAGERRGISRCG